MKQIKFVEWNCEKHYDNHVVYITVLNSNNQIVLYRGEEDDHDKVRSFGGIIHDQETPRSAATRYMQEELNINADPAQFLELSTVTEANTQRDVLFHLYLYKDKDDLYKKMDPKEKH